MERINFDNSSGEFVHDPNPLVEENLKQVKAGVLQCRADLGVCFDHNGYFVQCQLGCIFFCAF